MEDLTGKQFGSYQIVAPLGEGGMAAVYKAYQPAMERFVAVKVLPRHMSSSEQFAARFRREAKLVAQLQHPHILPVFDYGEAEGYPYIVMPFIVSGTLADVLRNHRVSLPEARRIISQIGDALSYAHARGMIHRDIKPSNILIDERGNCLLTDFGLARMTEAVEKITSSGAVMGTPAYMSPEQGMGANTDPRSDIYSLGIILYEMLTGRVPYTAETPIAVVFKHMQDPLPSARKLIPSLSDAIELVLLKSLAKNPEDRYPSADAFVQAVQQVISENPASDKTLSVKSMPALRAEEPVKPIEERKSSEKFPLSESQVERKPIPARFPGWVIPGIAIIGIGIAILVVMMSRANAPVTPTNPSTLEPAFTPTSMPTRLSSPTSILLSPTVQSDVMPPNGFRDEFEGQLADGWTWMAEDQERWSLSESPGWLQILASDASFDGPSFPTNVLVRDAPAGDFELTTLVKFVPSSNFQFAGLVVFQDKGNVLQFGRAFCDLADSCVGDGIYFDNLEDGIIVGNHKVSISSSEIFLRLQRVGATYTGYYSEDSEHWTVLGEYTRDFSSVRVGVMAAQAAEEIPAQFDYFTIAEPE